MKKMTKEWLKDFEYHELIIMLEPNSHKKIPFVFLNGKTDCVAKEDLYTVKTNLNVTEKENEINFIILPDTFDLEFDFLGDGKVINEQTRRNDFLFQYLNRLRIISYLPNDILKLVKDKRLLALGYVEKEIRTELIKHIKSKYWQAFDLFDKCNEASVKAEKGLTIHKQFKKHFYINSLPLLFDGVEITKVKKLNDDIYLTLDENESIVINGAETIEEEVDLLNSFIYAIELYKSENCYELHLLVTKNDVNFIKHFYYATYTFKDLKFINYTKK